MPLSIYPSEKVVLFYKKSRTRTDEGRLKHLNYPINVNSVRQLFEVLTFSLLVVSDYNQRNNKFDSFNGL